MKLNIAVVTVWADNFEETVNFYKRVLGMNDVHHESEGIIHFNIDDILFTVIKGKPAQATNSIIPRFPIIAFSVDDIEKASSVLKENEVALSKGIEESATAKWVMFNDPAGNLIELVQLL